MVNFPVERPSDQQGGMFVKLWVVPTVNYGLCSGVCMQEEVGEVFCGTDVIAPAIAAKEARLSKAWNTKHMTVQRMDKLLKLEQELDKKTHGRLVRDGLTVPLAASLVMGSTGWSGDFLCSYQDLNEQGKALYDNIKILYPQCTLHLATFLDT